MIWFNNKTPQRESLKISKMIWLLGSVVRETY